MNQTFDFHRFGLLLKLNLSEKGKNYLLTATLLLVLLVILMAPMAFVNVAHSARELLHFLALFMVVLFGSTLYTSSALTHYTSTSSGIAALMIPGSSTEKFLSALCLNLIFVVPFVFIFFEMHTTFMEMANANLLKDGITDYIYRPMSGDIVTYTIVSYFLIHGTTFLGSILFSKASYLKTVAALILIVLLIVILNWTTAYYWTGMPDKLVAFPFSDWQVWFYKVNDNDIVRFYNVKFSENMKYVLGAFPVVVLLGLWFTAYLRIKEKEI